ncbi:hypothetical protein [Mycobacterium paraterrae]|uniref:Threonine/Serine exporter ThrE domain-containing protein n=1 Tax=Mycobacterium paraterrae TaxID=577492 RepID=A0ABY3VMR8_9MYCO|nr:hypothetical protein [Mycobacterium paraterrae]UMB70705.1 hypothetical protein MKK62_05195 [Mycobacterium paraterrae]
MGASLFVWGSAAGAGCAWLAGRRDMSPSLAAAYTGVVCGLLGVLLAASRGATAPMAEAAFGFLGAAAPLTLCTTLGPVVKTSAAVRRMSLTLALAVAYGISCTALGFAVVYGIRHPPHTAYVGETANRRPVPS